jgi:ferrous iron transport protein A
MTDDCLPLAALPPGQWAHVHRLVGDPQQVHRLEELGLRGGVRVEMLRSGSPCIIRLDGHRLCFRDGELLRVLVRSDLGCLPGEAASNSGAIV